MDDFRAVIALWPSLVEMGRDLSLDPGLVKQWRLRDSIPAAYWERLLSAAAARGYADVTSDLLMRLAAAGDRRAAAQPANPAEIEEPHPKDAAAD